MAILKLSATALALGSAIAAQASPVLVSETITLGQVLNGNSGSFQFDLSGALASQGLSSGGVLSGSLVVYGISDASYNSVSGPVFGGYQAANYSSYVAYYSGGCYYSWWGGSSCSYYPVYAAQVDMLRSGDVTHRDTVADTMTVHAGGSQGADTVDQWLNTASGYSGWNYEGTGYSGYDRYTYYNRQRDVYEALQGSLEVSLGLDALAVNDLKTDGVLSFDVAASVGQFRVVSARLNLLVDDAPTGLPEPGTLALVAAAAVTGASFTRRRRKS